MKPLRHIAEAIVFYCLLAIFRALPLDVASALGASLMKCIGPKLPFASVARKNLRFAFPQKSEAERGKILHGSWEHLGRMIGELAHIESGTAVSRITIKGAHNIPSPGEQAFFVSGHFGNWELLFAMADIYGVSPTLVYRHLNNPYIDRRFAKIRAAHSYDMFPKGRQGSIKMGGALKRGESLALLFDQKMNEGIALKFFGKEAMTAPALAQMALRFDIPIIPARIVRTSGAHFEGQVYPKLTIEKTGDEQADVATIMQQLNTMLEGWIAENPEQWLWVHRRFDKDEYR